MKRWKTVQQFANELAKLEESNTKELNIAQCNIVASNVKNLYKHGGKEEVIRNLRETLPSHSSQNGFSMGQKDAIDRIIKYLFKWHWFPFSRIRNNMIRIGAVE